jgi:hypothetical protein
MITEASCLPFPQKQQLPKTKQAGHLFLVKDGAVEPHPQSAVCEGISTGVIPVALEESEL